MLSYKRFTLTDISIKIPRTAGTATVKRAVIKQDLAAAWNKTRWAQKLAQREKRMAMSDFDRFKLMVSRGVKRAVVGKTFAKLRKAAIKAKKI